MAAGCKNPRARNFDPTANPDDYSCVYMLKNQGNCHWFEDIPQGSLDNKSFTMSYSIPGKSWVFFHDYIPDMYIHTRKKLYTAYNNDIYKHNTGDPGTYYSTPKPFFIDVVFQTDSNILLETVNWMTDFIQSDTDQPFNTLTHISIWNSHQHTGRIETAKLQAFKNLTARNTKGEWVLNDFRNILINKGTQFMLDIFNDYALISGEADETMAWYKKELLIDKWFCVRFEFDNTVNSKVILHNTTIQAIKSDR